MKRMGILTGGGDAPGLNAVIRAVVKTANNIFDCDVLGHLQRGGSPTPFDRWLATRFGSAAVSLAARKMYGYFVGLKGAEIADIRLDEALKVPKRVDLDGEIVRTVRDLGICLGQ